jgi:hypothetical protein
VISIVHFGKTRRAYSDVYYTIYLATLSAFGIRRVESRDIKIGYGRSFVMHRDSMYFAKTALLAKQRKAQRKAEIESSVTKDAPRHIWMDKANFEKLMQDKLREAMEEDHNSMLILIMRV